MLMRTQIKLAMVIFFFAFIFSYSINAWSEEKKPAAALAEPTYNFGNVVDGTIVTHDFILQNKGDGELIIKDVKPG